MIIRECDKNFVDARQRPLVHCSNNIEEFVENKDINYGNFKFYLPDEDDWNINIWGKPICSMIGKEHVDTELQQKGVKYIRLHNQSNIHLKNNVDNEMNRSLEFVRSNLEEANIEERKLWEAEINTPIGVTVTIFRKMDGKKIEIAKEALEPLIKNGYVEKNNEYTSRLNPTRLVLKPNGSSRGCLDLRGLNELVKQDNYPIPTIANIMKHIADQI